MVEMEMDSHHCSMVFVPGQCHRSWWVDYIHCKALVTLLWRTLVSLAYAVTLWDQSPYNVMGSPCMDSDPAMPRRTPK